MYALLPPPCLPQLVSTMLRRQLPNRCPRATTTHANECKTLPWATFSSNTLPKKAQCKMGLHHPCRRVNRGPFLLATSPQATTGILGTIPTPQMPRPTTTFTMTTHHQATVHPCLQVACPILYVRASSSSTDYAEKKDPLTSAAPANEPYAKQLSDRSPWPLHLTRRASEQAMNALH